MTHAQGLSCYTAALHAYLSAEWDATAVVARSVRLAVASCGPDGLLAFSHHHPSLDLLPDGTRLAYAPAASTDDALAGVAAELTRHGRALVVVDSARLPWSVTRGGPSSPHWLLVDGRAADGWHVVDDFTALLPAGEQRPHEGRLGDGELAEAMTLPRTWRPVQRLRNRFAFGADTPVPEATILRLRRTSAAPATDPPGNGWRIGVPDVLSYLVDHLAGPAFTAHLDDLWAAAGHHAFACRWRLDQGAGEPDGAAVERLLAQWVALPRLLRLAAESAARGRPRTTLVCAALEALRQATADSRATHLIG